MGRLVTLYTVEAIVSDHLGNLKKVVVTRVAGRLREFYSGTAGESKRLSSTEIQPSKRLFGQIIATSYVCVVLHNSYRRMCIGCVTRVIMCPTAVYQFVVYN